MRFRDVIEVESNLHMVLRERGKLIERRSYHNVFTQTGRNLLSKLMAWSRPSSY